MTQPPTPDAPQIVVNAKAGRDQIEAGLRDAIKVIGPVVAVLAATGWGQKVGLADWFTQISASVGLIATIAAVVMGQIKTRSLSKKAAAMAVQLPDEIATTK